ncbi:MAG: PspC domain-containing protein [Candidatus Paceibacterota bacterium]|jgi:phage shock protein C
MSEHIKRLHRSRRNKVVCGLLGGLGEYFEVDPVLLRLFFVFITMCTGIVPGVLAYFLGVAIVPKSYEEKE